MSARNPRPAVGVEASPWPFQVVEVATGSRYIVDADLNTLAVVSNGPNSRGAAELMAAGPEMYAALTSLMIARKDPRISLADAVRQAGVDDLMVRLAGSV